jgi:hypothetical protein
MSTIFGDFGQLSAKKLAIFFGDFDQLSEKQ